MNLFVLYLNILLVEQEFCRGIHGCIIIFLKLTNDTKLCFVNIHSYLLVLDKIMGIKT